LIIICLVGARGDKALIAACVVAAALSVIKLKEIVLLLYDFRKGEKCKTTIFKDMYGNFSLDFWYKEKYTYIFFEDYELLKGYIIFDNALRHDMQRGDKVVIKYFPHARFVTSMDKMKSDERIRPKQSEMKVDLENYPFLKTAEIYITHIYCTAENIAKLIDVFDFKDDIEIIIDMGFADKKGFPMDQIENIKMDHGASFEIDKRSNGFFKLITSPEKYKDFLQDALALDVEIVFIVSTKNKDLCEKALSYDECRNLARQNLLDAAISVGVDANAVGIMLNKKTYDVRQIKGKIRALSFT
jgi:hypothetical protein